MRTPRISAKIFFILSLTIITIITIHTFIFHSLSRQTISSQLFLRGETLINPLWQKVNLYLKIGGNPKSLYGLSTVCEQIYESSPDIAEVVVMNSKGRILAHNSTQMIGGIETALPVVKNQKHIFIETPFSLDTYLPVYRKNNPPLLVRISFTKKPLQNLMWDEIVISVIFSISVVLIFLLLIFQLTNRLIGRRITKFLDGFKALADGQLDIRLTDQAQFEPKPRRRLDELDYLMHAFDKMAGQLREIDAKRKQQEKQLSFLATHDQLTGLPNRRMLEHTLKRAVSHAKRGNISSFMLMDLDNFKFVNDTLGHTIGDQVLVTVTSLLQKQLRHSDLLARLGGDEFALLLEGENALEAKVVGERICQAVEEHRFIFNNQSFHLGLSIGVVPVDGNYEPGTLLSQADTAMYSAKRQGRNRVVLYYSEDKTLSSISKANEIITKIKDALEGEGFTLYFQPVVRLKDNQIEHYEALLRLISNSEVISPGAFLPAAEQFGLMPQIDRWVVKHVIYTLEKHPEIRIYMNLSGYSLSDEELLVYIEESLLQYGVEPGRLGLEITETSVVQDLPLAEEWVVRLKNLGCRFALDDFGAGFNSFYYLRNLPINQLKLDGTFITSLNSDPTLHSLVKAMHDLAQALGIETVAEFVENADIIKILKEIGVTHGQGYYLGRPSPEIN